MHATPDIIETTINTITTETALSGSEGVKNDINGLTTVIGNVKVMFWLLYDVSYTSTSSEYIPL